MTKWRELVIASLITITPITYVWGQTPAPPQTKTFNLTVTGEDLQLISDALSDKPFGKVAPLFQKLQTQVMEQNSESQRPKTTEAPKTESSK